MKKTVFLEILLVVLPIILSLSFHLCLSVCMPVYRCPSLFMYIFIRRRSHGGVCGE